MGALYERFVRLKARLEAAGWFAAERKRPLPAFARVVGIVTSRHAAALRDVLTTLARRWPALRVVLYPAPVQGAGAADELAAAVRAANAHALVDILIVCRGGGSLEDLWAFNEESLARAIVESRIPVVSGVGHETDFTICDFVADVRAADARPPRRRSSRPTAPRSRIAPRSSRSGSPAPASTRMAVRAQRVDAAARRLVHPAARLARQAADAQGLALRLTRALRHALARHEARIVTAQGRLLRELRVPLPGARAVAHAADVLPRCGRARVERLADRVGALGQNLAHLDPRRVLARGYAIVEGPGGAIVQDAADVAPGTPVALTFAAAGARHDHRRRPRRPDAARKPRRQPTPRAQASSGSGSSTGAARRCSRSRRRAPAPRGAASRRHVGVLRAMAQRVVDQHQREHRLGDRRRANADARIVAAVRVDDHRLAVDVDRMAVEADRRRRLDRDGARRCPVRSRCRRGCRPPGSTGSPAASSRRSARCRAARPRRSRRRSRRP